METLEVATVTVDSLVGPDEVGLLWIDVEGHEAEVLAGAAAVVAGGARIVVEASTRAALALVAALEGSRSTFIDLRAGEDARSLSVLPDYLEALPGRSYTDILV